MTNLLEAKHISKRYGATQALQDVTFTVGSGEVVALVGENGAGKSTLIRVVSGGESPDAGTVTIDGETLEPGDPATARDAGVAVIHQELSYVGTMTVAENLALGAFPSRFGLLDRAELNRRGREAIDQIDPHIDLRARMNKLSVGARQLVEIARAVASGPRVLLLDEPTAALSTNEAERLFAAIERLKQAGIGMIYVSHRLAELATVADRITVLRDGRVVAEHPPTVERDRLVADIVGRELNAARAHHDVNVHRGDGAVRLKLREIRSALLDDVSLELRGGEILGLYGLPGSGVEELAYVLVGDCPATGSVTVDNSALGPSRTPITARRAGLALVPADRKNEGLFGDLSLGYNVAVGSLAATAFARRTRVRRERAIATEQIERVDIRPRNAALRVNSLSGGNQQKSLFARWLAVHPRVLVLDQPTRGVDVGAKAQIYELTKLAAEHGTAVLILSPEPDELLAVCSHIAVIHRGQLSNIVDAHRLNEDKLVAAALAGGNL